MQQAIAQGLTDVLGLPTSVAKAAIDSAAAKIREKLAEAGVNVPFAHGKVSIDATGKLTVEQNGVEFVWATQGQGVELLDRAGFKLKSMDLQPLSLLTPPTESETGQAILEKINEAFEAELDFNPPMVLINSDEEVTGSFLTRNGLVILRDIEFEVLGQSKIKVRDMLGAIEDLVKPGLGAANLPQNLVVEAFFELIEFALEEAGAQLVDFGDRGRRGRRRGSQRNPPDRGRHLDRAEGARHGQGSRHRGGEGHAEDRHTDLQPR